jgi:ribosome-binding factor A
VIQRTVEELNRSAGFISRQVARRVRLKRHPTLKFAYTDSTRYALDIEKLFHQLHHEEKPLA